MRSKFDGLVEPQLGRGSGELFDLLRRFGGGDVLAPMRARLPRCGPPSRWSSV
ncbi:MAG: hypothetical protein WDO24_08470 [Pseudomonadota bacterium]